MNSNSSAFLENVGALLLASNVKIKSSGTRISFNGLIGETAISISPGHRSMDGREISYTVNIDSTLNLARPEGKLDWECYLNLFASTGAVIISDSKLCIKSTLPVCSEEAEDVIRAYELIIFTAAMTHTYALHATIVDALHAPVSKGSPLPHSSDDGVWNPMSFSQTVSTLNASGILAFAHGCSLSAEFAWEPGAISMLQAPQFGRGCTSLLRIECGEHPSLGKGVFCRLDLPSRMSDDEANNLANTLNRMESIAEDWPLLGAWTAQKGSGNPTFVSFWPNMFSSTRIDVPMMTDWMGARALAVAGWLRENREQDAAVK